MAAIGRRVNTVCKHEAGLRQQVALFQVYHNFVLPHASLRVSLPELEAILRDGLHEALAATNAGDGGWAHGSHLESERGRDVPGATVAAAPGVIETWRGQ